MLTLSLAHLALAALVLLVGILELPTPDEGRDSRNAKR